MWLNLLRLSAEGVLCKNLVICLFAAPFIAALSHDALLICHLNEPFFLVNYRVLKL